jgi:hypothetical protein
MARANHNSSIPITLSRTRRGVFIGCGPVHGLRYLHQGRHCPAEMTAVLSSLRHATRSQAKGAHFVCPRRFWLRKVLSYHHVMVGLQRLYLLHMHESILGFFGPCTVAVQLHQHFQACAVSKAFSCRMIMQLSSGDRLQACLGGML